MNASSPQPQTLSVRPTPRNVVSLLPSSPQPAASPTSLQPQLRQAHNVSNATTGAPSSLLSNGGGVTRHHVWTVGTSKRNTKSALRSSALARHQQALQDEQEDVFRSPGAGGGTPDVTFDQQVHYGVAGYRADGGGVSFYRTSVHRKDPQNVVLSHGVMTRVVDLNRSPPPPLPTQKHHHHHGGGNLLAHPRTFSAGDDGSSTPPPLLSRYSDPSNTHQGSGMSPLPVAWSPREDAEGGGGGGARGGPSPLRGGGNNAGADIREGGASLTLSNRSRSPGENIPGPSSKPRWNSSSKAAGRRSSPPPTETTTQRSSSVTRGKSAGVSPQAVRLALSGGGGGGSRLHAPAVVSVGVDAPRSTSLGRASPPRAHNPGAPGSPQGVVPAAWAGVRSGGAGGGLSSRGSNASLAGGGVYFSQQPYNLPHPSHEKSAAGLPSSAPHGQHNTSGHDCRDAHCLHSRGDIVEVIAAKSQVRAMESQLLHEEIRREQLATALSSERERSQQLAQSLARAEASLQTALQQQSDSDHWFEAYERRDDEAQTLEGRVRTLETELAGRQDTIEQHRKTIEKLEGTLVEQRHELDEWTARYRSLSAQLVEVQQQQQQQQHRQSPITQQHGVHAAEQPAEGGGRHTATSSTIGSTRSFVQQHGPPSHHTEDGGGDAALRHRIKNLQAELDKVRDERAADDRLRRELLRALSDKERLMVSNSCGSTSTSGKVSPLPEGSATSAFGSVARMKAPLSSSPSTVTLAGGSRGDAQAQHNAAAVRKSDGGDIEPRRNSGSAGGGVAHSQPPTAGRFTQGQTAAREEASTTSWRATTSSSTTTAATTTVTITAGGAGAAVGTEWYDNRDSHRVAGGQQPRPTGGLDGNITVVSNETPTDSIMMLDVTGVSSNGGPGATSDNEEDQALPQGHQLYGGRDHETAPALARTSVTQRLF